MSKALIIEDDPMVALINKKYLERMTDYEVMGPVTTEEEVIEILKKEEIELILLDEYLPQKNGLEILKSIRNQGFFNHVIMVTAAHQKEEVQKAYAYGVIDYLVKPFEIERFQKAIEKHYQAKDWLGEKEIVNQKDIDKNSLVKTQNEELPKGLNKITLKKILEVIEADIHREWTLRGLAEAVMSSNVTVKKYMDYLEMTKQVYASQTCGQVGRPEYRYKSNKFEI